MARGKSFAKKFRAPLKKSLFYRVETNKLFGDFYINFCLRSIFSTTKRLAKYLSRKIFISQNIYLAKYFKINSMLQINSMNMKMYISISIIVLLYTVLIAYKNKL